MSKDNWVPAILPSGWASPKLGEICDVVRGGSPRPMGDPRYFGGTLPFVKIADVTRASGAKLYATETRVTAEGATRSRMIPAGRLILTNSATVCVPVFLGVDACIHDGFVAFEGLPSYVQQEFLYHFFRYIRPYVIDQHKQGVTQVNLNTGIVADMTLLLPPTNEQRRIVAKIEELFSELDKAVESLTTAREQLKAYRQSVLKQAFEGKLTADWRDENPDALLPPETLLSRIRELRQKRQAEALNNWKEASKKWQRQPSETLRLQKPPASHLLQPIQPTEVQSLPNLPQTWTYARLGEFIENIQAGNSFKCDEREPGQHEIGVAKVSAVTWGEYDEAESKTCIDQDRVDATLFIRPGDFLLSRANTIELVGACVIAKRVTKPVMLSDKTLRILFDAGNPNFVLYYLRSSAGRSEIEKRSTGNQESMRNIGQDRIRSILMPVCSLEEMNEIVVRLDALLTEIFNAEGTIKTELPRVTALYQTILQKAFSGQLVPQDPNDEPASILLNRIRAEKETITKSEPKKRAKGASV